MVSAITTLTKTTSWPADKVARWPVAKLVPNARNARTHSDEQVMQLAASIEEWGWTIPVLVDESGGIIAGHGRVLAAQRLGLEDVPVMVAAGWSESKKWAYMLADNKLTLNGEWDLDRLAIEIAELRESDFDISLTGFSESEIDDLLKGDDEDGAVTGAGSLAERFMIPPFSVLNAREGWWQERKAAWLALGIQSELGRGETAGDKLAMSESVQRLKPSDDREAVKRRARRLEDAGGELRQDARARRRAGEGDWQSSCSWGRNLEGIPDLHR